ncbi:MAG: HesB/IscA family protein [Gemmatimonadales bacterium]
MTTTRPEITVDIKLTDSAVRQIRRFMEQEGIAEEGAGLRVAVLPGGCSGFRYGLNIEDQPLDDDVINEVGGLRVFVDAFSAQYLNGTTIDYVTGLEGSGFAFDNPNATGGCGCGSSFTA